MPAQPSWFHRLGQILEALHALDVSHLDRLAVQRLFTVGERRARQLMAGLPGLRVGNAFAVERQALIARFENTVSGDRFQWEVRRRARLVDSLDRTRRELADRQVRIPVAAGVRSRRLSDLADGIVLGPGELRVRFEGAEDLAGKLFELSQAMANDWSSFSRAVEEHS